MDTNVEDWFNEELVNALLFGYLLRRTAVEDSDAIGEVNEAVDCQQVEHVRPMTGGCLTCIS